MGNFLKSAFKAFTNPIGTAVDLISGGVSSAVQANAQSKADAHNRDFVASENEKTRQFNAEQSQIARDFQVEQWNRQNEYNDPSNAMKRLTAAGLNPNLAYGELSNMATATPSTNSASSSGSGSPVYQPHTMGDVFDRALNYEKQRAEIEYIRSQSRGQDFTNDILASDAKFADALNQSKLDLNNSTIVYNDSASSFTDAQKAQLRVLTQKYEKEIDVLQSTIDKTKAEIANIDAKTVRELIAAYYDSDIYKHTVAKLQSEIVHNYASADLARQQSEAILKKLPVELLGLTVDSISSGFDSDLLTVEDGKLKLNLTSGKDFADVKNDQEYANKAVPFIGSLLDYIDNKARRLTGKPSGSMRRQAKQRN